MFWWKLIFIIRLFIINAFTYSEDEDLLIISTLDGTIHGINSVTGQEVWAIMGDPLVQTGISRESDTMPFKQTSDIIPEDEKVTYIVEPLGDGSLYQYESGKLLKKLPLSIKQLVALSPFKSEGLLYIGKKTTHILEIDTRSGVILHKFSNDPEKKMFKTTGAIHIGRVEYSLSIFTQDNSSLKYFCYY